MSSQNLNASIIVLNYFGEKVIKDTLLSLFKLNYPKNKYEIIVVDNGSKDKSKKILEEIKKTYQKKHYQIKLIYSKKNLGFAKGNNLGIKHASGKYIILLNNDCIVDKNWLKELIEVAEKDKNIFAVGSKILLYPKYFYLNLSDINELNIDKVFLTNSYLFHFLKEKKLKLIIFFAKNKWY